MENRRPALPALLELEHLNGVPTVVPENVEKRAERGYRRSEGNRQVDREGSVLLSKKLAGFKLVPAGSDDPSKQEVQACPISLS